MSTPDDASVPEDLADLFAAERARPLAEPLDASFAARLHARVIATAGPFPGGDGGDGGGGGAGGPGHGAGPSAAPAVAAAGAAALAGSAAPTTVAGLKLALAAAIFVAGGATGVVVDRAVISSTPAESREAPQARPPSAAALTPPPPPPASAAPPLEPVADAPSAAPSASATARVVASSRPAPSSSSSAALADRDADLGAERALLERARVALGRGDAGGAIDALSQHASRFPRARMGEEREAMWIQALVASGRRDEARARFERFRARNPQSLLVPALEATLGP